MPRRRRNAPGPDPRRYAVSQSNRSAGSLTPTGIRKRHARQCRSSQGGRCSCKPSYEAWLSVKRDGRFVKLRKTFSGEGAFAASTAWRTDMQVAKRQGALPRRRPEGSTLAEALPAWLDDLDANHVWKKRGGFYKPATKRQYRQHVEAYW